MKVKMDALLSELIFDNAIDSIELGIDDYILAKENPQRYQSSVRNLFAGLLLLFKSKLAEISKDNGFALLFENPKRTKKEYSRPETVKYQTLVSRLRDNHIEIDWETINNLREYRNDIEHFFSSAPSNESVVGSYIASCFIIIKKFIEEEFQLDTQDCFTERIWREMLKEEEFHASEMEKKVSSFDQLGWFSDEVKRLFLAHRCSECDSDLISIEKEFESDIIDGEATDAIFICRNCKKSFEYKEMGKEISQHLTSLSHWWMKDGDEELIGFCPECYEETYCSDGDICLSCGAKGPFICKSCGEKVPICELPGYAENGMCGWCSHSWEKILDDDDE